MGTKRLSFSAQLTNCNVGPCWRVMTHIGACWHSAFSTFHSLGQYLQWFYQALSFENSPRAGLGQILAVACATTETHSCPESTFAHFRWKALGRQTYINHLHDVNSWIKFRLYHNSFAPALGGACAKGTNAMALIQAIRSSQAAFLCTADKLQCWPILARNDTYWVMLAFSFLHISFIGTIASVVLSISFI